MDNTRTIEMVWPISVTAKAKEKLQTGDVAMCDLENNTVELAKADQKLTERQVLVLIEGEVNENEEMEFGVLDNEATTIIGRAKRK